MERVMIGAALAALAAAAEASPPQYRVIETGVQAEPTAFNNAGEIVFRGLNGFDAYAQAAIWSAGALSSPRTGYVLPRGVAWAQFQGWGLNDHGVMVGNLSLSSRSYPLSFRWDSRTNNLVILETTTGPDGAFVYFDSSIDINNAGMILGNSAVGGARFGQYGHVRDGETVRWLEDGRSFQPSGTVRALNEAGDVVGEGLNTALQNSGIVWLADGTRIFIDPLGAGETGFRRVVSIGINNTGVALFNSTTTVADEYQPFLWQGGVTTPLGQFAPGFTQTRATALNDGGAVVGWAQSPSEYLAFLWNGGTFWNLQSLLAPEHAGWTISPAVSFINNAGQIATYGCRPGVACQALLLDPIRVAPPPPPPPPPGGGVVPEPASWALLIAGFGIVGSALRRRRPLAAVAA